VKITIQCQYCGYTLKDYPIRGPTLPHNCPRCQAKNEPFKEHRDVLYIPHFKIPNRVLKNLRRK
jgi:predicted Zn-ribbon and HTH transcriptional regulator